MSNTNFDYQPINGQPQPSHDYNGNTYVPAPQYTYVPEVQTYVRNDVPVRDWR